MADTTLTMPQADEAKVETLMRRALVKADAVILDAVAPVDVFEAARRLGFEGRLQVIRGTNMVRVER